MDEQPQRPRFVERAEPQTPEVARRNRATLMTTFGVIALVVGLLSLANGGAIGLLIGLLGVGLLVGGLVIRP